MVLCSCGQFTDEGTTLCPRCEALHVLGLGIEALENEIRSAYRLQSKAWQPENFEDDPKLKDSAEAKLKDIQTAYEFLTQTSTDRTLGSRRPIYLSANLAAAAAVPEPISELHAAFGSFAARPTVTPPIAAPASATRQTDAPPQESSQTSQTPVISWQKYKIPIAVLAGIAILLIGVLIWSATSPQEPATDSAARVNGSGSRKKPMNPLVALLAQALNAIDPQPSTQAPQSAALPPQNPALNAQGAAPQANTPDQITTPAGIKNPQPGKSRAAPHETQPVPTQAAQLGGSKLRPYITVGSTRAEVIALEGNPTASSEDKLVYGKSELTLKDGVVVSWRIDRAASPLRVKLWPRAYVDPYLDFFSVGSSKDEVLKVQGTPTAFTENQFEYGGSIVYFSNNHVIRWKSDPSSVTLWGR
jgi:hypothetical protein